MAALTADGASLDEAVARAEGVLGHEFERKSLVRRAITHSSAYLTEDGDLENYERLEFLGDSVLGAIVAEWLYETYPEADEGALTRMKVSLVSGSTLSRVAAECGLADAIVFGESEAGTDVRGMRSSAEDVFESCVAALYFDGGIGEARRWVLELLAPLVDESLIYHSESPKSELQELLQAHQKHPEYRIASVSGPAHDQVFNAQVLVDGEVIGEGSGRSKKDAERSAAERALEGLGE